MRGNIKREGVGVGRVRGEDLETGGRVVVGVLHLYLLTQMVHTQPATGHGTTLDTIFQQNTAFTFSLFPNKIQLNLALPFYLVTKLLRHGYRVCTCNV